MCSDDVTVFRSTAGVQLRIISIQVSPHQLHASCVSGRRSSTGCERRTVEVGNNERVIRQKWRSIGTAWSSRVMSRWSVWCVGEWMCSDRPYVVSISQCSLPAPLSVVTSMWILRGGGQHTLAWYRAASYDKVAKSGEGNFLQNAPRPDPRGRGSWGQTFWYPITTCVNVVWPRWKLTCDVFVLVVVRVLFISVSANPYLRKPEVVHSIAVRGGNMFHISSCTSVMLLLSLVPDKYKQTMSLSLLPLYRTLVALHVNIN